MRGKHVSQTIEKLVKEAEGLARDGVKVNLNCTRLNLLWSGYL
jgi:tRNA A37 methylthiotransferase MiaB